ncbi:unnamed protein product [Bemisia tabaci]|uniref:Uncharacterized protein n=1 Tax=Bemisia tabaci TaxID=7038 RepID=A0A9P0A991_BEMTA|nr:unnamed protein product [Bemisia tabaci]
MMYGDHCFGGARVKFAFVFLILLLYLNHASGDESLIPDQIAEEARDSRPNVVVWPNTPNPNVTIVSATRDVGANYTLSASPAELDPVLVDGNSTEHRRVNRKPDEPEAAESKIRNGVSAPEKSKPGESKNRPKVTGTEGDHRKSSAEEGSGRLRNESGSGKSEKGGSGPEVAETRKSVRRRRPGSGSGESGEDPEGPTVPADETEPAVRKFKSEHEDPPEVPTKVDFNGSMATPPPGSGIKLDFVPRQTYVQVRRTDSVKRLPQSAAYAAAKTPEERDNAGRLREVVSHKKSQEVYEEQGYEDSAYDHGGYKKKGEMQEAKVSLDKGHHGANSKVNRKGKDKIEESPAASVRKPQSEAPINTTAEKLIFYPKVEAAIESASNYKTSVSKKPPTSSKRRPQASHSHPVTHYKKHAYTPPEFEGAVIEKFVVINGKQIPIFRKNLKPMKNMRTRPFEDESSRPKTKKRLNNKKKVYPSKYPDVPSYHSNPEVFVTTPPKFKYVTDTDGKYSHSYNRPTTKLKSFHPDTQGSLSSAYHFTNPGPFRYVNKVEVINGKPKSPTRQRQRLNKKPPSFPESEESHTEKLPSLNSAEFESSFKIKDRPALNINPPSTELSIFGEPDTSPWVPITPPPEYQNSPPPKVSKGGRKPSNGPSHFKGPPSASNFDDGGPIVNDKFIGFPDFPNEFPNPDMKPPKAKLPQKHLKRPKQNSWLGSTHDIADNYKRPHSRPKAPPSVNQNYNSDFHQYTNHEDHFNPHQNSPFRIKSVARPHESAHFGSGESTEGSSEVMKHRGRKPESFIVPRHPGGQYVSNKFRNTNKFKSQPTRYSYFNRENDPKEPYEPQFSSFKKPKDPDTFKFENSNFRKPGDSEPFNFETDIESTPMSGPFFPYQEQSHPKKPPRKSPVRTRNKTNNIQKNQRPKNQNQQPSSFESEPSFGEFPGSFESEKFVKNVDKENFGGNQGFGNVDHFPYMSEQHEPYRPSHSSNHMGHGSTFSDYSPQFNVHSSYSFEPSYPENIALTTQAHMEVAPTYPSSYNPVPPPTAPLDSSKFFSENHEHIEPKPSKMNGENSHKSSQFLEPSSTSNLNVTVMSFSQDNSTTSPPLQTTSEQPNFEKTTTAPREKPNSRYRWRPRKQPTQHPQLGDWSGKNNSSRGEIFRRRTRPKQEIPPNQFKLSSRPDTERDSVPKPSNNYYPSVMTPPKFGLNDAQRFPHLQLHYTVPDFSAMKDKGRPQSGSMTENKSASYSVDHLTDQVMHATSTISTREKNYSNPGQGLQPPVGTTAENNSTTHVQPEVLITTASQNSKHYQTVSRQNQTVQETEQTSDQAVDSNHSPINSRHPFLPKDMESNMHGQQVVYKDGGKKNQSDVLVTYYGSFDVPEKVLKNEKPNEISELPKKPEEIAPIKYIENLTLQHYSMPENSLPYQPLSNTQQNRIINIANELNKEPPAAEKNSSNRRHDVNKPFFQTYMGYPYSAVDGRNERAFNLSIDQNNNTKISNNKTDQSPNVDRLPLTVHINKRKTESDRVLSYSDLLEQLEKQRSKVNSMNIQNSTDAVNSGSEQKKRTRRSAGNTDSTGRKRMLLEVASEGTTTLMPIDVQKFPFYTSLDADKTAQFSPLRYAQNPQHIPKKSGHGMEFYESRKNINCDDPEGPQDVVPKRAADGEWNERPQPESARLPELGDRIRCFRRKFFDEDPLDNPFFKEEFIGPPQRIRVAKVIYEDQEDDKNEDADTIVDDELREEEEESEEEDSFEPQETRNLATYTTPIEAPDKIASAAKSSGQVRRILGDDFGLYKDVISNIKHMNEAAYRDEITDSENLKKFNDTSLNSNRGDKHGNEGTGGNDSIGSQSEKNTESVHSILSMPKDYIKNHKWQHPRHTMKDTRKNQTFGGNQFMDSISSENDPEAKHAYFQSDLQNIFQNRTKIGGNYLKSNHYDNMFKDPYFKNTHYTSNLFQKSKYAYPYLKKYRKPTNHKHHKIIRSGTKFLIKKRPLNPIVSNSVYDYSSESQEVETDKEKLKMVGVPSKQIIHMYQQAPIFDLFSPLENLMVEPAEYSDTPIKIVHNFYNLQVSPKTKKHGSLTDHHKETEPEYSNYNYNYNYYDENSPGNEDPEHPEYATSPEYAQSNPEDSDYGHSKRRFLNRPKMTFSSYPSTGNSYPEYSWLPSKVLNLMGESPTGKFRRHKRDLKSDIFPASEPFSMVSRMAKSVTNHNSNATTVNNLIYNFIEAEIDTALNKTENKNITRSKKRAPSAATRKISLDDAETFMKTAQTMFYPKLLLLREVKIDTTRRPEPLPGFVSRHNPVFSSRYNKELTEFHNGTWTMKRNLTTTPPTTTEAAPSSQKPRFKFRFPSRAVKQENTMPTVRPVASESNSNFSIVPPSRNLLKPDDILRRPKHVDVYESLRRLKGEIIPSPPNKRPKPVEKYVNRGSKVFSETYKQNTEAIVDQDGSHDTKESPSFTESSHLTDFVTTINPMKDSLIYVVAPESGQGQWMKEIKVEMPNTPWQPSDPYESVQVHQKRVPVNNILAGTGLSANYDDPFGFHYGLRTMQHRKTPSRSRGSALDQGQTPTTQTIEIVKLIDGAVVEEKVNLDVFSADLNG